MATKPSIDMRRDVGGSPLPRWNLWNKYSFLWVTLALFLGSLIAHFILGWADYQNEQQDLRAPAVMSEFLVQWGREIMENWQSEFLQLVWQIGALRMLYLVGSPQSKEEDDRLEEKLNYLIRKLDPEQGEQVLRDLERKYPHK